MLGVYFLNLSEHRTVLEEFGVVHTHNFRVRGSEANSEWEDVRFTDSIKAMNGDKLQIAFWSDATRTYSDLSRV